MSGRFLNIDVDIHATSDLSALRDEFGDDIAILYCGEPEPGSFRLSFEWNAPGGDEADPDAIEQGLCTVVERLSASGRELWNTAADRIFDIGYEAESGRESGQALLRPATLVRIGSLGARLACSIYTHTLTEPSIRT
ncbi:hypothetical protein [Nocardia crassostreae]|uniref:hypothetical protein n=1 Tax=Nocardia crassostreae TaxID=53428 RepID=UPI0012F7B22F|nr:hypothetical protein [Nocardia crassostreae]